MAHPPPTFAASATSDVYREGDPAPVYQAEQYSDIWAHWKASDSASQRVIEIQGMLAELENELQKQTEELGRLKNISSNLFACLHDHRTPPVLFDALRKVTSRSNSDAKKSERESLKHDFEMAHREETSKMLQVEKLRGRIDTMKLQMERKLKLASQSDQIFELLGASISGVVPSVGADSSACEENLASASSTHDSAQNLVTDLLRAQVTIQHSHHYYTVALNTIDSVRGTAFSLMTLGPLGDIGKRQDYHAAAKSANKAQVCFNETVRVLSLHTSMIPQDILADIEKIKEMGLLQASKIYQLACSWRSSASGTAKSFKLMLNKQEIVFACLTRVAVWVQNRVPVAEADLRAARSARDEWRRNLVAIWEPLVDAGNFSGQ